MARIAALLSLLLTAATLQAEDFDHSHSQWSDVLSRHVRVDGGISWVDYQGIRGESAALDAYLSGLQGVTRERYSRWSAPQQLAFLINAYNAFTVKLILDHYPVGSIKDLGGWLSSPWKRKFFTLFGEPRHLDNLEHDLIRRNFDEPRIHFAVNCASVSCPALRPEAYRADALEEQLEEATRSFLRDRRRNRLDLENRRLHLSPLFGWYPGDFEGKAGSLLEFVAARVTSNPREQNLIREGSLRIAYLDYDWSLNDWRR